MFEADGVIRHLEHLADLVLSVGPTSAQSRIAAFCRLSTQLLNAAIKGRLTYCNEKIDGSPTMLLGFDADNRPFVGYGKGALGARAPQKILRDSEDLQRHYGKIKASEAPAGGLYNVFAQCVTHLLPHLASLSCRENLIQGDLLFVEGDNRRSITADTVVFRANPQGIEYKISRGHPLFERARQAKVAIVLHSGSHRTIASATKMLASQGRLSHEEVIHAAELLQQSAGNSLLVLTPYGKDVDLAPPPLLSGRELRGVLRTVRGSILTLSTLPKRLDHRFLEDWPRFESTARIFFNRSLKEGHRGGIYRAARDGEHFDFSKISEDFKAFLGTREASIQATANALGRLRRQTLSSAHGPTAASFEALCSTHAASIRFLFEGYFIANRIQARLIPFLNPGSILGGGPIEGLVIESPSHKIRVKLVDRMGFTLQNNRGRWMRGTPTVQSLSELHPPFTTPLPAGTLLYVIKGQPFHRGHIDLIRDVAVANPSQKLLVVASNKAARHDAATLAEARLSQRVADARAGRFDHPFSLALRQDLLRAANLPSNVEVHFVPTGQMWAYLSFMRDRQPAEWVPGKYRLVVGEKEIQSDRYNAQLSALHSVLDVLPHPMLHSGLNATSLRECIRILCNNPTQRAARRTIEKGFGFIQDPTTRENLITAAIEEWRIAENLRQRLSPPKASRKISKSL